jgi:hypothetical protein
MPTVFEHGNSELVALVESPTLDNLAAYFDARTAEWCEPIKSMECFTVGVFYDLTAAFEGAAAFDLLDTASQMITDSMPSKKFSRYVDLLSDLAGASDTTEMPSNLARHWNSVIDREAEIDPTSVSLASIRAHYMDIE